MMAEELVGKIFSGEVKHEDILQGIKEKGVVFHEGSPVNLVQDFVPKFLECLRKQLISRIGSPSIQVLDASLEKSNGKRISLKQKTKTLSGKSVQCYSGNEKFPVNKQCDKESRERHNCASAGSRRVRNTKIQENNNVGKVGVKLISSKSLITPHNTSSTSFSLANVDDFPSLHEVKKHQPANKQKPRRITPTTFGGKGDKNTSSEAVNKEFGEPHSENLFGKEALLQDINKVSRLEVKMRQSSHPLKLGIIGTKTDTRTESTVDMDNTCALKITKIPDERENRAKSLLLSNPSSKDVLHAPILIALSEVYSVIVLDNLVPNIMLELSFLFQVMLASDNQPSPDLGVELLELFTPLANCVYFAVKSLEKLLSIVILLEKNTLQLMASNYRVKEFSPALYSAICESLEDNEKSQESVQVDFHSPITGIPYRAESDNKKMFVSDRHFYSFSKQRDQFYSIVREWEENRFNAEWSFESYLEKKIREHFHTFRDYPNHMQFADLFSKQLIEMCTDDCLLLQTTDNKTSLGFLDALKKSDPERYQRLQERFTAPSTSKGPCPKPQFNNVESFFQKFILLSDSYVFLKNLADALAWRLNEIEMFMWSFTTKDEDFAIDVDRIRADYEDHVKESRLLGKFLGLVTFLPYHTDSTEIPRNILFQNLSRREKTQELFDPTQFLQRAVQNKRLILTLPWLVDFLSMIDGFSCVKKPYTDIFDTLLVLYKSLRVNGNPWDRNTLFQLFLLGWLFETSHVPNNLCYREVSSSQTPRKEEAGQIRGIKRLTMDELPLISTQFLYVQCSFLEDLKSQLINAARGDKSRMGSFRKITPISAEDETTVDRDTVLRMQLVENFFRYQPKFIKETHDFLVERAVSKMKGHAAGIIAADIKSACTEIFKTDLIFEGKQEQLGDPNSIKLMNDQLFRNQVAFAVREFHSRSNEYCSGYCNETLKVTLCNLLPDDLLTAVVDVVWKIARREIKSKMDSWLRSYCKDVLEKDISGLFHREIMQRLKRQ